MCTQEYLQVVQWWRINDNFNHCFGENQAVEFNIGTWGYLWDKELEKRELSLGVKVREVDSNAMQIIKRQTSRIIIIVLKKSFCKLPSLIGVMGKRILRENKLCSIIRF